MSADPAERAPALVQVRNLYKEFRLGTRTISVLRDVNLTLREGDDEGPKDLKGRPV